MIFTAMILVCEINTPKTFDTCIVLSDQTPHRTEEQCMDSVADLLNNELFQMAYMNYELEEYKCYSWLHTEA